MSLPDLSSTPRTELGRHRERGRTDRDDLYAVLDAGLICHLGVIVNGVPRVLPTGYGRLGDLLYLHGSSANSSIMAGYGQEVCVTVTHLDGLVCARSVFNHSILGPGIEAPPHIIKRSELTKRRSCRSAPAARLATHGRRGHRL
jgi:hypothetical protein